MSDKNYYCGVCREWFEHPAANVYCPRCGAEEEPYDPDVPLDGCCSTCGYIDDMEFICPQCGVAGCKGGLAKYEPRHPS